MFTALLHNVTIVSAFAAYLSSQVIKLIIVAVREKRFDLNFLSRLGGMPSSHASTASACALSVGLRTGFDSPVFAVAFGLVALVMIDAQSVRRAAGAQARLLNQLAEEFRQKHPEPPVKLSEALGHTRTEVFVGAVLGVAVAWLTHALFPSPGSAA
jgi:acid phosphatase family membrane protein YuiD